MFKRLRIEAYADNKKSIENLKTAMMTQSFELARKQGTPIDAKFLEESNKRFKVTVEEIENGYRLVMDIDLS